MSQSNESAGRLLRKSVVLAVILVAATVTVVGLAGMASADWSQFQNDEANTGSNSTDAPTSDVIKNWSVTTGDFVTSSPAVADGTVYVGSWDGDVYALNAADGNQKWAVNTNGLVRSSPAVGGDTVYVGSDDNTLYALDRADGSQRWTFNTGGNITAAPALSGDTVYVSSADNNIYAVNATDGTQRWSYSTGGSIQSSPAVAGGRVYVGSDDGNVYALNAADGSQQWSFSTGAQIRSAPTVVGDTVYVGSDDNSVYAVNATDGTQRWSYATGGSVQSSPAVAGGTVYVGSFDNTVYALDNATGSVQWQQATSGRIQSSPAVADNTVYVGSDDASIWAMNATDGSGRWSYSTSNSVTSSPAVSDGSVFVGSKDQSVYALSEPRGTVDVEDEITEDQTSFDVNAAFEDTQNGDAILNIRKNGVSILNQTVTSDGTTTISSLTYTRNDNIQANLYETTNFNNRLATDSSRVIGTVDTCTTIGNPGTYYLTGDIIDSGQATCIEITANDVEFDGRGHTIDSDGSNGQNGVYITGTGNAGVRNVSLSQWTQYGIGTDTVTGLKVYNVTVSESGVYGVLLSSVDGFEVYDVRIINSGENGLHLQGGTKNGIVGSLFADRSAQSGTGTGVRVGSTTNVTLENVISTNTTNGGNGFTFTQNADGELRQSVAFNNTGTGIRVNSGTVALNGLIAVKNDWDFHAGAETVTVNGLNIGPSTSDNTTLAFTSTDARVRSVQSPPSNSNTTVDTLGRYVEASPTSTNGYVDLGLSYTSDDALGILEEDIALWAYDGSNWNELAGSTVDTNTRTVSANVSTAAPLGLFGPATGGGDDDGTNTEGENLTEGPAIDVDTTSINFGDVRVGEDDLANVTVTNGGDEDLTLDISLEGDGAFDSLATVGSEKTIDPGESATYDVEAEPTEPGEINGTLVFDTNAGTEEVDLAARGVQGEFELVTGSVDFGTVAVGARPTESVVVRNNGTASVGVGEIAIGGESAFFDLGTNGGFVLDAGEERTVGLTYLPEEAGTNRATVTVDDPDENRYGTVDVVGEARESRLTATPAGLAFGTQSVSETATREITIEPTVDQPVDGVELGVDSPQFTVTGDVGTVNESVTVPVTYEPTDRGTHNATLAVRSGNATEATVTLNGTATAPELAVSPTSVQFDDTTVSDTVAETVVVENVGDEPLAVNRTNLSRTDVFELDGGAPFTVDADESRELSVRFSPDNETSTSAYLRIESNDPAKPNRIVSLSSGNIETTVEVDEQGRTTTSTRVSNVESGEEVEIDLPDSEEERYATENVSVIPEEDGDLEVNITSSEQDLETTPETDAGFENGTEQVGNISAETNLDNENIEEVQITTRVNESRLEEINSSAEDVVLERYNETQERWVEQDTDFIRREGGDAILQARGDGFSEWTAAAKTPVLNISDTNIDVQTATTQDDVTIQVLVTNTGGADGSYEAVLFQNEDEIDRQERTVPNGGTVGINFERSFDDPGDYQLEVNEVFVGEVAISAAEQDVEVEEVENPSVEANDDGTDGGDGSTDGSTAGDDTATDDGSISEDSTDDGSDDSDGGLSPVVIGGIVVLLVIIAGAGGVYYRQQQSSNDSQF